MLSLNSERFFPFTILSPSERNSSISWHNVTREADLWAAFPGPANNIGIYTANHFNLPTVLKLSDQAESINPNPVTNGHWNRVMNLGEDEEESSSLLIWNGLFYHCSVFFLFLFVTNGIPQFRSAGRNLQTRPLAAPVCMMAYQLKLGD